VAVLAIWKHSEELSLQSNNREIIDKEDQKITQKLPHKPVFQSELFDRCDELRCHISDISKTFSGDQ
jgi:hypothetical protein